MKAVLVSWMGFHLGLIKFHQKDLIPSSGTVLGKVFKLAKLYVSVSHPAEQDSDTCLPMGRIAGPLAEQSHSAVTARHGCETARVVIREVSCVWPLASHAH